MCLGNDLPKDDETKKNSIDRRDFWTVFYEMCSAWGMIDDTKKLFRSQRFGIVFYECLIVPGKDLAKDDDTKKPL